MKTGIWAVTLLLLATSAAAQLPDGDTPDTVSTTPTCTSYLGTLKEGGKANLRIPTIFGSYQAVRSNKVPAAKAIDKAAAGCRDRAFLPNQILERADSTRVVAAGRASGTPWIAFLYPAERKGRTGYQVELVQYNEEGNYIRNITVALDVVDSKYRDYRTSQIDAGMGLICSGTSYLSKNGDETPPGGEGNDPQLHGTLCEAYGGDQLFLKLGS